jgi:hypothetical protein
MGTQAGHLYAQRLRSPDHPESSSIPSCLEYAGCSRRYRQIRQQEPATGREGEAHTTECPGPASLLGPPPAAAIMRPGGLETNADLRDTTIIKWLRDDSWP